MSNDTPFYLVKVECPICKTVNEFEAVKVGAYVEGERDTDFCPRGVQWKQSRYQAYNPLVFFTATCSNCFYTREFTNQFKEWKNDATFKTYRLKGIKEKHLEKLAVADSVIKALGDAIDTTRHPNESAIIKLHLAIADEALNEHCSALDLGRFYLRIGWVLRDLVTSGNPNAAFLTGLMLELDKQLDNVKNSQAGFKDSTGGLARCLAAQFDSDEMSPDLRSKLGPYRERFDAAMTKLDESLDKCRDDIDDLADLVKQYKAAAVGENGSDHGGFGKYASFVDFLLTLKKDWNGVVVNEREALEKAAYYYREAFTNGRDIAPGNQQIQAAYLIAELSRRIGDHDGAKQFFNTTIKLGQEFIYEHRRDQSRTALARKILELAIEQGRANLAAMKSA